MALKDADARSRGFRDAAEEAAMIEEADTQEWIDSGAPAPMAMWRSLAEQEPLSASRPLTVRETAQRENVSVRTVYRWVESGELGDGAWKVGAVWRISADALDARRVQGPRPRRKRVPAPAAVAPVTFRRPPATPNDDWPT